MRSALHPVALMDIAISFRELAPAVRHIVPPVTLIGGSVDSPDLDASAVTGFSKPFTSVDIAGLWAGPRTFELS